MIQSHSHVRTVTTTTRKRTRHTAVKKTRQARKIAPRQFMKEDLITLLEKLYSSSTRWFNMGLVWGIPYDTLQKIQINCRDNSDICLREMLIARLDKRVLSKEEIIAALDNPTVGKSSLARDLELNL